MSGLPQYQSPFAQPNASFVMPTYDPNSTGFIADPAVQRAQLSLTNPGAQPGGFMNSFSDWGNSLSAWGPAMQGASGLAGAFMGMQQYGLAKDALKFQKSAYEQNYANQRQMTNSQLEDRQRARVAANPGAYQSVGDYMDQNRIR